MSDQTPSPTPTPRSSRWRTLGVFALGLALGAVALGAVGARDGDQPDETATFAARTTGPTTFTIGSLNVLGAGHTAPGGNRKGWASGDKRMKMQIDVINATGVDVVGFQELQPAQLTVWEKYQSSTFGIWPGRTTRGFMRNSIAWRSAEWRFVSGSWIKVPYFNGDKLRMPVVLLQNVLTGQQAYFMNFQNPADARGNASRWRAEGRSIQIGLVNRLRVQTGLPVFWTGDLNDREKAFCPIVAGSDLVSANGGSHYAGKCRPTKPMAVDWIFGSEETEFSGYVADRQTKIKRSTDHPFVRAVASIPPGMAPICPIVPTPTPTPTPTATPTS